MSEHDQDAEKVKANDHKRTEMERFARELKKDLEDGVDVEEAIRRHEEKIAPLGPSPCQMACYQAYYQCVQQHRPDCDLNYSLCLAACE